MPFVFAFLGVVMVAIGMRGHAADASKLLASEFTGPNSFVQWFLAIMVLGLIGYYKPARPVTDALLGLVILSMILAKANPRAAGGGFFQQLEDAFQNTQATPANKVTTGSNAVAAATNAGNQAAVQPMIDHPGNTIGGWPNVLGSGQFGPIF